MTLAELTDPEAVLRALAEYDALGEEAFLGKYEMGVGSDYWLHQDGRRYQSKAIAAAAHWHQTGQRLSKLRFSGGLSGAAARLRQLGFTVPGPDGAPAIAATRQAFEVMWNPGRWEWDAEDLAATRDRIAEIGTSPDRWSTGRHKDGIEPGDRIFLLLVGTQGRGLIGSGHATSHIYQDESFDPDGGLLQNYVDIAWDALLERGDQLPRDEILAAIPGYPKVILENGNRFAPEVAGELNRLWQEHLGRIVVPPSGGLSEADIETGYRVGTVRRRLNQDKFRELLLARQPRECVVCGITRIELLEAAHIVPYSQGGASSTGNGRLLCANHHKAHDAGLLQIDLNGAPVWAGGVDPV